MEPGNQSNKPAQGQHWLGRVVSKASITWLFIVALIPGLAVGTVLFFAYQGDKREDLERGALQTIRVAANAIDKDMEGIASVLEVLASSPALLAGDFRSFHEQAAAVIAKQKLVNAVVLLDEQGVQRVNTLYPWGKLKARTGNAELLSRTLEHGGPQYSNLYIGGSTGIPYIAVQTRVIVHGKRYALTMAATTDRLARYLATLNLPTGWTSVIIDTAGKIVARNHQHAHWVGKPALPEFLEVSRGKDEGIVETVNLDGIMTLTAFKRAQTSGWVIAMGVPVELLRQGMLKSLLLGSLLAVICLGIGVLLALTFSHQIRRRLKDLETASELAAAGDLSMTVRESGPPELAKLARRFNEMQAARQMVRETQERVKRALLLLNESNTLVLAAEDERTLLGEICRLLVEQGGYQMAWVGFAVHDEAKTVAPLAAAGVELENLAALRVNWSDDSPDQDPTGMAIRTGSTRVIQDIPENPAAMPAGEAPEQSGCRSSIALPIVLDGQVVGALSIYASEPASFRPEEISLLERLAGNLSLGMERIRNRNRLAAAVKQLQAFTYAASHDLKSPLHRISSFASLLEKSQDTRLGDEGRMILAFIQENATRMTDLVKDLLDHAEIEQNSVRTRAINLRDSVLAIRNEMAEAIDEAGASIDIDVPDLPVAANPVALAQVLRNLLENALKYSRHSQPPAIFLSAVRCAHRVRLSVKDNGVGFDMKHHDRIFEIFHRLHSYNEFPGNGVGLALVKKAVEGMGGRVWAEGVPGEGATFTIELDAAHAPAVDQQPARLTGT